MYVQVFGSAFSCFEYYETIMLFLKKYQATNNFLLEMINQYDKAITLQVVKWASYQKSTL